MSINRAATLRPPNAPRDSRKLFVSIFLLVTSLLVSQCILFAQQEPATQQDEVIRVNTDLITVPVIVSDTKGQHVAGLTRDEFELRDDGRRVELDYFAAGADRVALTFLLDASGSAREIIMHQRETALALFSHFGESSRVSVIQFREQPALALPFTADLRLARAAFQFTAGRDRRTALFDAALAAVRNYNASERNQTERRIVILISDGLDTASAVRAPAVVEEASKRGVSFYVIHLPLFAPRDGRLVARQPSKGFHDLAEKTGGQFFTFGDARTALDPHAEYDLQPIFRAIADDLRGQYILGYYAGQQERTKFQHRFDVRLRSPHKRNLRVRLLREGYVLKAAVSDK